MAQPRRRPTVTSRIDGCVAGSRAVVRGLSNAERQHDQDHGRYFCVGETGERAALAIPVTERTSSAKPARLGRAEKHLKEACDAAFLLARHVDANESFAHDVIKKLQHHLRRLETLLRRRDP